MEEFDINIVNSLFKSQESIWRVVKRLYVGKLAYATYRNGVQKTVINNLACVCVCVKCTCVFSFYYRVIIEKGLKKLVVYSNLS